MKPDKFKVLSVKSVVHFQSFKIIAEKSVRIRCSLHDHRVGYVVSVAGAGLCQFDV